MDHPLRKIRPLIDDKAVRRTCRDLYSKTGRPSIPPEQLLKSQLLIAFHSVRSDRLFCEQLAYNFLFRWFLDLAPEATPFDASTFSKNRERLLAHDVAHQFFDVVVRQARRGGPALGRALQRGRHVDRGLGLAQEPGRATAEQYPSDHDGSRSPAGPQGRRAGAGWRRSQPWPDTAAEDG
jgi:transposase